MKLNESFKKGFLTPNMWAIRPSLIRSDPIIRNGHIRHGAEISGNFKKPLLKGSYLTLPGHVLRKKKTFTQTSFKSRYLTVDL